MEARLYNTNKTKTNRGARVDYPKGSLEVGIGGENLRVVHGTAAPIQTANPREWDILVRVVQDEVDAPARRPR